MERSEVEKYKHKTVRVKYLKRGNRYDQVGIASNTTISKLVLLLFDDDHEVYVPYDGISSIKEIDVQ